MDDSLNRAIDLNYANFKMHGQWRHHVADTGEFIFPGYVSPNEIVGYIIRENPESDWKTPIDLAFFLSLSSKIKLMLSFMTEITAVRFGA